VSRIHRNFQTVYDYAPGGSVCCLGIGIESSVGRRSGVCGILSGRYRLQRDDLSCKGCDVALSVTLTSVSTVLSPFITPFLTLFLAGKYVSVPVWDIFELRLIVILLPVSFGVLL